jgi:transposase
MVSGLPREGLRGPEIQGRSRSSAEVVTRTKERLAQLLLSGPFACGFRTGLWTLTRLAQIIQKSFGVQYHLNHVWRLLLVMGRSCQKPERRTLQRKEDEIAHWKRYR